jgi:hypothetical protein
MPEPPPSAQRFVADGPRVPVSRRARWLWTLGFEALLVGIMVSSDAGWAVRGVVIALGTFVIASIHVYWRVHGMPARGTP